MKAMENSGNYALIDVDEFFVGGQEEGKKGKNKKLVVKRVAKALVECMEKKYRRLIPNIWAVL